jgi:hypothetical protein
MKFVFLLASTVAMAAPTFNKDIAPILVRELRHLPQARRSRSVFAPHVSGRRQARGTDRDRYQETLHAAVEARAGLREFRARAAPD